MNWLRSAVTFTAVAATVGGCESQRFPNEPPLRKKSEVAARVGTCDPPPDVRVKLRLDAGAEATYCGCIRMHGYGHGYPPIVAVDNCVASSFATRWPFFVVYAVEGLVDGHLAPSFTARASRGSGEIFFYTFYPDSSRRVVCPQPEIHHSRRISCKEPDIAAID